MSEELHISKEVTLKDVFLVVWESKILIASLTSLAALISIVWALSSEPIYRSVAILEYNGKSENNTSLDGFAGSLGGIAQSFLNTTNREVSLMFSQEEAVAYLQSREVIVDFFHKYDVAQTLYPEIWNDETKEWLDPENVEITDWKLYNNFLRDFFQIKVDQVSKLIYLTITMGDPVITEKWNRGLIDVVNAKGRDYYNSRMDKRIYEAEKILKNSSEIVLSDQSAKFIETLKREQLNENTKPDFLFSYVDEPVVPVQRFAPNRTYMVLMGTFSGGVLSVIIAFVFGFLRNE